MSVPGLSGWSIICWIPRCVGRELDQNFEQLSLELVPIWNAGSASSGFFAKGFSLLLDLLKPKGFYFISLNLPLFPHFYFYYFIIVYYWYLLFYFQSFLFILNINNEFKAICVFLDLNSQIIYEMKPSKFYFNLCVILELIASLSLFKFSHEQGLPR